MLAAWNELVSRAADLWQTHKPLLDAAIAVALAEPWKSLLGVAAGLFAGAWITSRSSSKKAAREELRSVQAATALAFAVCNRFLALKIQIVLPLLDDYQAILKRHAALVQTGLILPKPTTFSFRADLQNIAHVKTPIDALEKLVFEKISMRGRGLLAASELIGVVDALKQSISQRNELVAEFKTLPEEKVNLLYLGLRNAGGHVDERFKKNLEALVAQTDDCIFFSKLLAEDLSAFGNRIRRKYRWRFYRLGISKFHNADWTKAEKYLPSADLYKLWLANIRSHKPWWRRIFSRNA